MTIKVVLFPPETFSSFSPFPPPHLTFLACLPSIRTPFLTSLPPLFPFQGNDHAVRLRSLSGSSTLCLMGGFFRGSLGFDLNLRSSPLIQRSGHHGRLPTSPSPPCLFFFVGRSQARYFPHGPVPSKNPLKNLKVKRSPPFLFLFFAVRPSPTPPKDFRDHHRHLETFPLFFFLGSFFF